MSQSTTSKTPASASVKPRETAPPDQKCMGCKHWRPIMTVEREPLTGNCMRFPPAFFQGWNSGGTDDVRAWMLPVTPAEHYCGEWAAAPAPASKEPSPR